MTTGIVLTSAALPFLLVGAALSNSTYQDCLEEHSYENRTTYTALDDCREGLQTRAYALLAGTVVMLGVGIPLIVYGAKKVPDDSSQALLIPWATPTAGGATLRLQL
jgi:hypothetical protein